MLASLPFLIAPLLILALAWAWAARFDPDASSRHVLTIALIAWGATLVAMTEVLSAVGWLDRQRVSAAWLMICLAAAAGLAALKPRWRVSGHEIRARFTRLGRRQMIVALLSGCLLTTSLSALAFIAYKYPPNTWDSMTYHLPRVMHWAQQGSVAHYATNIDRQIWNPPFAEFVLLHIQLLTGSDRWMNLVQWSAFLLSIIGVSEICRKLGGGLEAQWLSAILVVAIPMALMQATSTQNDLVVSLWIVTLVNLILGLNGSSNRWEYLVLTGLCLGLALLTKGTAVAYVVPFCLWLGVFLVRRSGWKGISQGMAIGVIALAIMAGHFLRNRAVYGDPVGPSSETLNAVMSPGVLASNMLRNLVTHVPLLTAPGVVYRAEMVGLGWLEKLNNLTGFDAVDPRITFTGNVFTQTYGTWRDEDYAGNALHTVLILISLSVIFLFRSLRSLRPYALTIVAAFVLFSFLFKWQPWGSRLQLPAYLLWAPVLAIVGARKSVAGVVAMGLFVWGASVPWLVGNRTRPLRSLLQPESFARRREYFAKRPGLHQLYLASADQVLDAGCDKVGLELGEDTWEYPIWVFLRERGFTGEIRHVGVENQTGILEDPAFLPCAIVVDTGSSDLEVRLVPDT